MKWVFLIALLLRPLRRLAASLGLLAVTQLTCGPRISFKAASIPLQVSASSV
jgi:hypothetical protein